MNPVLCGLAANPALPPELVDRLIEVADADLADDLAGRADLSRARAAALLSRVGESGVALAHAGRLAAADVDPAAHPSAALALLDEGRGSVRWARRFAADPVAEHREKPAACPGLPAAVMARLVPRPRGAFMAAR
ncbi:hypothetical protein [Streptomyces sp. NPDC002580]|uniref:hypothetical protein n=1 Tax=Streptomyces sp. NPDC002580 TaxID=3364653 RepID=UPI003676864A